MKVMQIFFWTIISLEIFLIFACTPSSRQTTSITQKPVSSTQSTSKTAVFVILAPDIYSNSENLNYWTTLKKTQGNVHIFADNASLPAFDSIKAVKHSASREKLSEKMAETLESMNVDRLLLFISTHGAPSGNWCYENQNQCHLSENTLIEFLKKQAELSHQPVKEVLIVPLSCFNKPIMERFGAKMRAIQWPFSISYLRQQSTEACGTQSPGETLLENLYIPFEDLSLAQIDDFLSLKSMGQFIDFSNNLVAFDLLKYDLISTADILLANFGFDLGVIINLKDISDAPALIPDESTVRQMLEKSSLDKNLYKFVRELSFQLEDYSWLKIKTNGDLSTAINKAQDKKYIRMDVILRNEAAL